jgi:hypothetical protein
VGFRGDFKKLRAKVEGLATLASPRFVESSAKSMGEVTYELAKRSIASHTAPTGRPWPALASGGTALANVGRGIRLEVSAAGFRILIPDRLRGDVNYLAANQQGARHAPKRNGKTVPRAELQRHARMQATARRVASAKYGRRPTADQVREFLGELLDDLERDRWRLPARRILPRSALPRAWRKAIDGVLEREFGRVLSRA